MCNFLRMEIADKTKERSTVILAVLSLCIIGCTLIIFTFQTFRHQREAEEQHLFLTTKAVLLSAESSMRRVAFQEGDTVLTPQTIELFRALEQDDDLLFVGIVDEKNGTLLTAKGQASSPGELPPKVLREMLQQGEWHGRLRVAGHGAYISGKRLKPLRGLHLSLRDALAPPPFLVVGVDMERQLSSYKRFRRSVLFQGVYILAAALLTWGLGFSFLSRREQARKAVALENFQAKLLDNLPDGLITLDEDGIVRSANPAALAILKRPAPEVLGRSVEELPFALTVHTEKNRTRPKSGWQHISHGQSHLEVLALPLEKDKESSCLLIIRDRTELHKLEKSLADAEKLAAVGTLAAGVAHEVRNPLSSLRGFAQYFVKKLAGRAPEEEYAKTMVREADRLNRVISDLLFLGRPKAITPKYVNIGEISGEILSLLRFDLEHKGVSLHTQLDAVTVYADGDALKQALLNLLLNSLDALNGSVLSEGNEIQMPLLPGLSPTTDVASQSGATAQNRKAGNDRVSKAKAAEATPFRPLSLVSGTSPGGVWVEVRDRGCGMTANQKAKAFEAFFTAKERGTGLGLALVQRTMLDHGGSATITSEPGKGCTVRLFFPDRHEEN